MYVCIYIYLYINTYIYKYTLKILIINNKYLKKLLRTIIVITYLFILYMHITAVTKQKYK